MKYLLNNEKFQKLLHPKNIVVFGSRGAGYAIRECQRIGFQGEIWAVHPTRDELDGIPCYRQISDLPAVPDAAYVAVNADNALKVVEELAEIGCGGALLYASGFAELGEEGAAKQDKLVELAGDMPLIGPNCYGMINALDRVALWPDQHGCMPVEEGAAIITQSGNIALNMTMQKRGVPISYIFTLGNQANVSISEAMEAVLEDNRVTAIGLHIESLKDIAKFDEVARLAHAKKVPIVAMKTGRSSAAAKIALSHTSSLSGPDACYDALFDRLGIARVSTVTDLLETLKLLAIIGPMKDNKLASISCSGGEAGMMADLVEETSLCFPEFAPDHAARVKATLGDYVAMTNPLDYHTYIWGDEVAKTAMCEAVMNGKNFDATMLLLDWPNYEGADPIDWDTGMDAMITASLTTGAKGIVLASMAECMPEHVLKKCAANGVAPMIGLDSCLMALEAAYKIGKSYEACLFDPLRPIKSLIGDVKILDEWKSKKILQHYGLRTPEATLVTSATEAVSAAESLGYPVVVKVVGDDFLHKTEMGGVKINLTDGDAVYSAVESMQKLTDRFLVEKMVGGAVAELIIGVKRDDQFGPSLVLGSGGILVELIKDSQTLLLPVAREDIEKALENLKVNALLNGFRGKPAADREAIIEAVLAVARFVEDNSDKVEELDINPLLVCEKGQGAYAADALIRMIV